MSKIGMILSCPALCTTFPKPIVREVSRDALLNQIDERFNDGISLVRLDGRVDIGKTRTLCQFALRHSNHAISVFIRSESWYLQDPSLLYADVASQMFWILHQTEPPNDFSPEERTVRMMSFELQKKARKANQLLYFILDGVEDIASTAGQFLSCLLRLLPTEYSQFRFLCSGDTSWIPSSTMSHAQRNTLTVTGFSFIEASYYLEDLGLELKQVEEIYLNCGRGVPGYLASARRSLDSGLKPEELIQILSDDLHESFSVEWDSQVADNPLCIQALAILAHDSNPHSIAELAKVLKVDRDALIESLKPCSFLDSPVSDLPILFVSESFRRFAAKQLADYEAPTWNILAEYYSNQNVDAAIDLLPGYLQRAGRQQELLSVLNPIAFMRIAERSDSFLPLQQRCDVGLTTALELKRYDEMLRFQLQSAVVAGISQYRFAESEVVARLSLDDYATAIEIAQTASLRRNRLQLMAAIARVQKEKGLIPESTLTQAVETLVQQIDPRELGDELVQIASDLMFIKADLALSLVSRSTPNVTDSKNIDRALLKMSAIASDRSVADAGMSAALEDIQSKIKNPSARQFAKTLTVLVNDLSPTEVLRQAKAIEGAGDQLFFLRQWCSRCKQPEYAAAVLDYAVHFAIRTTEYLPSATDFKSFSEPLPRLASTHDIASLITSLDLQKETARNAGPTQDFVSWQILLAQAEQRLNPHRAGQRLFEIYDHVFSINELDVKTVCLGLIVAALPTIDPSGAFEDTAMIGQIVEAEFISSYRSLLGSTADHYTISKPMIEAVGQARPDLALDIIQQINYESRRDLALENLVDHLTDCAPLTPPIAKLASLLGKWHDSEKEDDALDNMLGAVGGIEEASILLEEWPNIYKMIERGLVVQSPTLKCRILSYALVIMNRVSKRSDKLYRIIVEQMKNAWICIGDPAAKLRSGYRILRTIADHDRELAIEYLHRTDEEKLGYTDLSNRTYISSLQLMIRAFSGLLPRKLELQSDLERIATLIEKVPSAVTKIYLWTDITLRIDRENRNDIARDIVRKRVITELETLKETCLDEWLTASVFAAPALYCFSAAAATQHLKDLPGVSRDFAYNNVLRYLATGAPPGEPYQSSDANHHLGYEKCIEILKVAESVDIDYLVYKYISIVAEASRWDHNRFAPSQQQKNELAKVVRELSGIKFPNTRGITHDGFAILSEAQATRLLREKNADWSSLISRARALTNEADKAFVLMHLAEIIHSGYIEQKRLLLEEAHQVSLTIPSAQDRVERLNLLAGIIRLQNSAQAKVIVKEAAETLRSKSDDTADELYRNVVDLAYLIEPEFASSLTSIFDNDKGRQIARARLTYQKGKEVLKKDDDPSEVDLSSNRDRVDRMAWDLLGGINADRIPLKSFRRCVEVLKRMHGTALHSQFGTFSWALENLIKKRGAAGEAESLLRGVFESLLTGCEVAAAVVSRAAGASILAPKAHRNDAATILIKAGQRESALNYLSKWLALQDGEALYICDPYFGRTELEAVQLVQRVKPEMQIRILTSRKKQEQDLGKLTMEIEEAYRQYWRQNFSEQDPRDCEVIVIGDSAGALPIHDRWWLTKKAGLRIGTSFNQLGISKDSDISSLDPVESAERLQEIIALINRERREHLGQRLTYQAVPL